MFLYGNKKDALHRLKNMLHKVKGNQQLLISTNMMRSSLLFFSGLLFPDFVLTFQRVKKDRMSLPCVGIIQKDKRFSSRFG